MVAMVSNSNLSWSVMILIGFGGVSYVYSGPATIVCKEDTRFTEGCRTTGL